MFLIKVFNQKVSKDKISEEENVRQKYLTALRYQTDIFIEYFRLKKFSYRPAINLPECISLTIFVAGEIDKIKPLL